MNYTVFKEIGGTHILYSDRETNRFEFFDFSMTEIARIQPEGIQQISARFDQTKKFHSSLHDPHIFLWPCGNSHLGIIDLSKNEYSKIDNLGGTINNLCHTAVSCDMGRRIMSCTYDSKTESSIFSYWSMTSKENCQVKQIDSRELKNSSSDLVDVLQVEVSTDTRCIFAIGNSLKSSNTGILTAFSFDGYFDQIGEFRQKMDGL